MIFSYDGKVYNYSYKRLNNLFLNYAAEGEDNYAKAYVTWISPKDYLSLTVPGDVEDFIAKAQPLDYTSLCAECQEIFLTVNFDKGVVVGHEGRHRMAALHKAGANMVAVTVIPNSQKDKYNRQFIENFLVYGQSFPIDPPNKAAGVVNLRCLTPVNMAHKDLIYNSFGPISPLNTFKDLRITAVDDVYQFSTGYKVSENRTYIGKVIGFSENPDCMQDYDSWFPFKAKYVWFENEKNPKNYQKYAVKVSDFLNWIQEGKYVVPKLEITKDLKESLEDVIKRANALSHEQLIKWVERSFERE